MIKTSTGLRNKILDTGSLKSRLAAGFLKIYTGTEPATADAAVTGTLLCTIYSNYPTDTVGLTFAASAAAGVLAKNAGETWSGANVDTGTAGYFRFVAAGDTGVSSATEERLQGSVGLAGADLNLSSISLVSGQPQAIDYFVVALPTA